MKHSTQTISLKAKSQPVWAEYLLFGLGAAVCFLLFNHPDIQETARHAYILIRSTLDGDFFGFYENTLSRVYGYGYVNAAHYSILMYILYALWELPLYLIEQLGGFAFSDLALTVWCKLIGTGFYLGCGFLTGRIAEQLELDETACKWAPLLFWLNPVSFFTVLVMGQYDSICLFFTLWAVLAFLKGKYRLFCVLAGVGIVFKFFPVFLLVPLLLLVEKKPLRLLGYGALSLWLYIPTTLLFLGRTGDASYFTKLMADQLLGPGAPVGMMHTSLFGLVMVIVCAACYLYRPKKEELGSLAVYLGLAVFSTLFFLTRWHPQWLILVIPFMLLTTLGMKNRLLFACIDGAFSAGFFVIMAYIFPRALEGNLLDMGVLQPVIGLPYSVQGEAARYNAFYFDLIPYFAELAALCFYGALVCGILFKLPIRGRAWADRLDQSGEDCSCRLTCWLTFAVAFGGFWFAPSLFSYLKTLGLL